MTLLTLTTAQAALVATALTEAEQYRRDIAKTWCPACAAARDGACPAHLVYVSRADDYRGLRHSLAQVVPLPNTKGQPQCCEHRSWPESATP